nr:hypothetical protein [Candidatus Dadabacteria bacterium]NIS09644.1 hypothetical protein [Candidatus Dadabacteria bacterium]NIV42807.1 hypothetical protein [Candidatus Dadabacteria bacterium]NIX15494.1 hypothetical protein [Candidatus Dadabacteria bacterium]NIY22207.1 hypothetical protein [Candidatus Dadabacteria bacterium]
MSNATYLRSAVAGIFVIAASLIIFTSSGLQAKDRTPADLNDLEIAHVAYTA